MEVVGSKLSDKIISEGLELYPKSLSSHQVAIKDLRRLREKVEESPVFYIQNVADYFRKYMIHDFRWDAQDLPCIAPPFPSFFMEFKFPKGSSPREKGIFRAGVLFEASESSSGIAGAFSPE